MEWEEQSSCVIIFTSCSQMMTWFFIILRRLRQGLFRKWTGSSPTILDFKATIHQSKW